MNILGTIKRDVRGKANPRQANINQRFFKTGIGEYGEGDQFLGLTVPESRVIAKKYRDCPLDQVAALLQSPMHEERMIALFILINQFVRGEKTARRNIFDIYLRHTHCINNWDLVDASADKIVGAYLSNRSTAILAKLAKSKSLWERRIAIIATLWFIRQGHYDETLKIARLLLRDPHDLIHKAVGWMLREVGKRDRVSEEQFLERHHKTMPRTMLRYAIEKFPEPLRKAYLRNTV